MFRALSAMVRMLTQPAEVYPWIRDRSPVLWPMLIVMVIGALTGLAIVPATLELVRQGMAMQPELPEEAVAMAGKLVLMSTLLSSALVPILAALVTALILTLGMLFTGGALPYRQALSLTLCASGPLLLDSILKAGMITAGIVDGISGAITSAALILGPEAAGTWPYRLLDLVAPLEWWYIALLAGGVRSLGDTSSRTGWVIALVVWLLLFASLKLLVRAPAL